VTYLTKALVRLRGRGGVWHAFLNPFSGAQLVVRTRGIEVSLAPPLGRFSSAARYLSAEDTTMWIETIGPHQHVPIGRKESIRLSGHDANGAVELAVSPSSPIEQAWRALLEAGVRPSSGS